MTIATIELASLGQAANRLRVSAVRFERVAAVLGIQPALLLNGVPHFLEQDIDRIAEHLDRQRQGGGHG